MSLQLVSLANTTYGSEACSCKVSGSWTKVKKAAQSDANEKVWAYNLENEHVEGKQMRDAKTGLKLIQKIPAWRRLGRKSKEAHFLRHETRRLSLVLYTY